MWKNPVPPKVSYSEIDLVGQYKANKFISKFKHNKFEDVDKE